MTAAHLLRDRLLGTLAFTAYMAIWLFDAIDPRRNPGGHWSSFLPLAIAAVIGYRAWPAVAAAFARVPDPSLTARLWRIAGGFALSLCWMLALALILFLVTDRMLAPAPTLVRLALLGTVFGYLAWPGFQQWWWRRGVKLAP